MEGPSGWNLMSSTFLSVNLCLDSTIRSHVMNTGSEKPLIYLKVNDWVIQSSDIDNHLKPSLDG